MIGQKEPPIDLFIFFASLTCRSKAQESKKNYLWKVFGPFNRCSWVVRCIPLAGGVKQSDRDPRSKMFDVPSPERMEGTKTDGHGWGCLPSHSSLSLPRICVWRPLCHLPLPEALHLFVFPFFACCRHSRPSNLPFVQAYLSYLHMREKKLRMRTL